MVSDPMPRKTLNILRNNACHDLLVSRRAMLKNTLDDKVSKRVSAQLRDIDKNLFYQLG
jgi:hypothetical protein